MYRANCKHCISQIRNISKYADRQIHADAKTLWIEVETEAEVELIEKLNRIFSKALAIYLQLINLTKV